MVKLPDSPLTNPRSMISSLGVHALLLFLASLVVVSTIAPEDARRASVIRAEIGPIDNRVLTGDGGGGLGELGGIGSPVEVSVVPGSNGLDASPGEADHARVTVGSGPIEAEPVADEDVVSRGVGALPGSGLGGGGGSGSGSGGGVGSGVGSRTEFFGVEETATSFLYVIDRSGSMTQHRAFDLAKQELLASIGRLAPDARFGIIFYNLEPQRIPGSSAGDVLMPATPENLTRVRERLADLRATGGTDHLSALRSAFAVGSEVVYFLTDARHMSPEDAEMLRKEAGACRIQAVLFGVGSDSGPSGPLEMLASSTGGSYRYVDVLSHGTTQR